MKYHLQIRCKATICNKVVQLTNHRRRALTLKRNKVCLLRIKKQHFFQNENDSKVTYRSISHNIEPSDDSLWTICCNPEDGENVAVLYNEPYNLKLIKVAKKAF